jgi:hypothetical protein
MKTRLTFFASIHMPLAIACLLLITVGAFASEPLFEAKTDYVCGDVNNTGTVNHLDETYLVMYLINIGPPPPVMEAADLDGCVGVNVGDATYLWAYLKAMGPAPNCGVIACPMPVGGSITLENGVPSTGHYGGDTVLLNSLVTFTFRLTQNAPCTLVAFTNGFEVYTTLSAADPTTSGYFDTIQGDTVQIPGGWLYYAYTHPNGHFDEVFINLFSADGLGKDTISFDGFWLSGHAPGFMVGFSDDVWYVRTTPHVDGDTLCVDSAWFRPTNNWIWSLMPGCESQMAIASWGGPYCFHVSECICGDINGDKRGPNVADLTHLVDYLFRSGPPPRAMSAANVDGQGGINVADVTYIVNYLFHGGPEPVC